jgi:hypothetical protein
MKFNKDDFNYHGGYLTYEGDCGKHTKIYGVDEGYEKCHPSRVGTRRAAFVARFKNGGKPQFLNFLIKHFEVEEYFDLVGGIAGRGGLTPQGALETKGYLSPNVRKYIKSMNDRGGNYPVTLEGYHAAIMDECAEYRKTA